MSGTIAGGKAAAATNKAKYGADFYAKIGSEGGKNSGTGGFWYRKYVLEDTEGIRKDGAKGGKLGKRTKTVL